MWIPRGAECVSDDAVVARSPIAPAPPVRLEAGWQVSGCHSDAALTITDCTPLAKVHVRAPWNGAMAKALGVPFGRASREAGCLFVGSGPGEWLVLAPPGSAGHWLDWRRHHQACSRWYHQRTRLARRVEIALLR